MAFRINWDRLDDTTGDALVTMINARLAAAIDGSGALRSFQLTGLQWGAEAPLVELRDVASSRLSDMQGYGAASGDLPWPTPPPSPVSGPAASPEQFTTDDLDARSPTDTSVDAPPPRDPLKDYLYSTGLNVRLHVAYGGGLVLSGALTVGHTAAVSPACSVGVTLPISFSVTNLRLDATINLDLHHDTLRMWLDPPESPAVHESPLSMMDASITLGDTSADKLVDCDALASLVLEELQALLDDALVFPNCVEVDVGPNPDPADDASTGYDERQEQSLHGVSCDW